jgi:hypothetical protein
MGQAFIPGGNHIKSLAYLETPPAVIRCGALSWPRGLQQNSICSARVKNHCTLETGKFLLARCQNVYISATASERIVDTIEFFPHNYQMPQLSSIDRLIMAANDMSNAL